MNTVVLNLGLAVLNVGLYAALGHNVINAVCIGFHLGMVTHEIITERARRKHSFGGRRSA